MKQATRTLIAGAAAEKVTGRAVQRIFDHSEQLALPFTRHLADVDRRDAWAPLTLHVDSQESVSLSVRDDLFVGWDHLTGAYFAGAMYESEVMLFDSLERRYYRFRIHQAAPAAIARAAPSSEERAELHEM
jgi:hypothetical protein